MATYNTVIKKRNAVNNGWDSILPITTAENVLTDEQGGTVATHLAESVTDAGGAHGLKMSNINLNAALVNGWDAYTTPVTATRIGNRVFVSGGIKEGTVTAGTTIFTLPEGYRPAEVVFVPVTQHTATPGVKHLRVNQDGTVIVDNNYAWSTGSYFFDFNFYTMEA
jgi:hypothetical protein